MRGEFCTFHFGYEPTRGRNQQSHKGVQGFGTAPSTVGTGQATAFRGSTKGAADGVGQQHASATLRAANPGREARRLIARSSEALGNFDTVAAVGIGRGSATVGC